jgi:5-oxoprolinase (ATP-hydrolysing) subunit A
MDSIDINCDMGESFGAYDLGNDEALMDFVSSVNIACGFHAGDPAVMQKTVALAAKKNVAIGAHPGYPDLQGFGRRDMALPAQEVYNIVVYQVGALQAFTRAAGAVLHHVKPHGALYNTAAKNKLIASAIAHAIADVNRNLILVGLSGSHLIAEGNKIGLKTCNEVFSDRCYEEDGSLTPRTSPHALIEDPEAGARHVLKMVKEKKVLTRSGTDIPVTADTVCIHGDGKLALPFAKAIVNLLTSEHVRIEKF